MNGNYIFYFLILGVLAIFINFHIRIKPPIKKHTQEQYTGWWCNDQSLADNYSPCFRSIDECYEEAVVTDTRQTGCKYQEKAYCISFAALNKNTISCYTTYIDIAAKQLELEEQGNIVNSTCDSK